MKIQSSNYYKCWRSKGIWISGNKIYNKCFRCYLINKFRKIFFRMLLPIPLQKLFVKLIQQTNGYIPVKKTASGMSKLSKCEINSHQHNLTNAKNKETANEPYFHQRRLEDLKDTGQFVQLHSLHHSRSWNYSSP